MAEGLPPGRSRFRRHLFLLSLPDLYLSDEELVERNRLNQEHFKLGERYFRFLDAYGWDRDQVDRQDAAYLAEMDARLMNKSRVEYALVSDDDRKKLAEENNAEDTTTRKKTLQEIRDINPWLDHMDDETLKAHIKRGRRRVPDFV